MIKKNSKLLDANIKIAELESKLANSQKTLIQADKDKNEKAVMI